MRHPKLGIESYRIFDTCSESVMLAKPYHLIDIILTSAIKVVNASVQNDGIIEIKKWPNSITTLTRDGLNCKPNNEAKFVLIATRKEEMFKVIDYSRNISNIGIERLKGIAKERGIANCDSEINTVDTYKIKEDKEFEQYIQSKYKIFTTKAMVAGYSNIGFKYIIENHEVKLQEYTGSNKNVILPSFITSIMREAFSKSGIEKINLNEGLKVIGVKALENKNDTEMLTRIEIPSTVELIGAGAFNNQRKLFKRIGHLETDTLVIRNRKTIMLDQMR